MANASAAVASADRFFCHRCKLYINGDIIEDFTCPFCQSGFLEQVDNRAGTQPQPQPQRQSGRDGIFSNIRVAGNRGNRNRPQFPNLPTILRDVAFLMSGNELSEATRQRLRNDVRWSMVRGQGNQPQRTMPFVFLGSPGDYVFGGEAMDAVVAQLFGQLEHSGIPPMPQDILEAIPSVSVTAEQASGNMPCSVCWENLELGEMVSHLECDHIFHTTCINPWLELHATCPVCRRSLLPPGYTRPPTLSTTTTTTTATANTTATATANTTATPAPNTTGTPLRPRPFTPRVVIRRSTHPLFRRPFQTHTWNAMRDANPSSGSTSSVTTGGRWASQAPPGTSNNSSSVVDRTQNYHTDFDCD